MATYSLAITGARADYLPSAPETVTLPDAAVPVAGTTITTATLGGMANAMSKGTPLLCKNRDGSFGNYTLDPERSTPDVPVLRPL